MTFIDYDYKGWSLRFYAEQPLNSKLLHGSCCYPAMPIWDRKCAMCKSEMSKELVNHFTAVYNLLNKR